MKQKGIGFIGCGAIGSAFINGMIMGGKLTASEVWAYDYDEEVMRSLRDELNIQLAGNYQELLENSSTVFLAVKHGDYASLLKDIAPFVKDQLVVSAVAGISIAHVKSILGRNARVVRLMPNTPCLIGEGAIAISSDEDNDIDEALLYWLKDLLSCLGKTVIVNEDHINAVTGLSGSGPAYVYLFMEALVEGGVKAGLDRDIAEVLALQTIKGSAEMMERKGLSPSELKRVVTSPGGTTSYGLHVLETRAMRAAISDAVEEACNRAREIGEKE